ncbi:hypothetical protein SEA_LAZERLEMON_9 [Streptomyces phage LazerLemon]|nr:hypothetical protein SEA_LAZERLEMON_9 [Streptomyces phage LazerLemon]
MAQRDEKTPQTGDNPNKPGVGPNKGDLKPGDISWVTPPPGMAERNGVLEPVGKGPQGATVKVLSKAQRRDLAGRIKAKLGLAASKREK